MKRRQPPLATMSWKNKGQANAPFGFIVGAVLAIVFIVVAIVIVTDLTAGVNSTQVANSSAWNTSQKAITMFGNIQNMAPSIGLVLGGAMVILVIIYMFGRLRLD